MNSITLYFSDVNSLRFDGARVVWMDRQTKNGQTDRLKMSHLIGWKMLLHEKSQQPAT